MYQRIFAKNVSWQMLYEGISTFAGLIFYLTLARRLDESGLGLYSYVLSFMSVVLLFLNLGLNQHYLRKWSIDRKDLHQDFSDLASAKLYIAAPLAALVLLYMFFLEKSIFLPMLLAFISTMLDSYIFFPISLAYAQNRFDKSFRIQVSDRLLSWGLGIVFIFLGFSVAAIFAGMVFAKLVSLAIAYRFFPFVPAFHCKLKSMKSLLIKSLPLFFTNIATVLYFKIDIVMIRHFLGVDSVGLYSAAYKILETLLIGANIVANTSFPIMTTIANTGTFHHVRRLSLVLTIGMSVLSAAIAVIVAISAKPMLLFLYGPSFLEATRILRVLSITIIFLFTNTVSLQFLYANRYERALLRMLAAAVLLNVALNAVLLPIFGLDGAAWATLACEVFIWICIQTIFIPQLLRRRKALEPGLLQTLQ